MKTKQVNVKRKKRTLPLRIRNYPLLLVFIMALSVFFFSFKAHTTAGGPETKLNDLKLKKGGHVSPIVFRGIV